MVGLEGFGQKQKIFETFKRSNEKGPYYCECHTKVNVIVNNRVKVLPFIASREDQNRLYIILERNFVCSFWLCAFFSNASVIPVIS